MNAAENLERWVSKIEIAKGCTANIYDSTSMQGNKTTLSNTPASGLFFLIRNCRAPGFM